MHKESEGTFGDLCVLSASIGLCCAYEVEGWGLSLSLAVVSLFLVILSIMCLAVCPNNGSLFPVGKTGSKGSTDIVK